MIQENYKEVDSLMEKTRNSDSDMDCSLDSNDSNVDQNISKEEDRSERIENYVKEHDVEVDHNFVKRSKKWLVDLLPTSVKHNKKHFGYFEAKDQNCEIKVVICYKPRIQGMNRISGHLKTVLAPQQFKQLKFSSKIPHPILQCFYNYIPPWINGKSSLESFSSKLLLYYYHPNNPVVIKEKAKPRGAPFTRSTSPAGNLMKGSSQYYEQVITFDEKKVDDYSKSCSFPSNVLPLDTLDTLGESDDSNEKENSVDPYEFEFELERFERFDSL